MSGALALALAVALLALAVLSVSRRVRRLEPSPPPEGASPLHLRPGARVWVPELGAWSGDLGREEWRVTSWQVERGSGGTSLSIQLAPAHAPEPRR